jgi:hypothetical protein
LTLVVGSTATCLHRLDVFFVAFSFHNIFHERKLVIFQTAQVTNPAIDPFREAVVTSLRCFVGPEGDITTTIPQHARRLELSQPILTLKEMGAMKVMNIRTTKWKTKVG